MRKNFSFLHTLVMFVTMTLLHVQVAEAKKVKKRVSCTPVSTQTSLIVNGKTGEVLHAQNARARIYPASLTKLKTLKLVFEAIESGKLSMNSKLYVSKNAEKMPPSKLGLREGESIAVRDAINALIIKSANDAAVVLAEGIAGSEARFAKLMNARARALGMHDTNFENASGWHHPNQKSTALDLAKLSIALKRDHPRFYPLFSQTSFEFRGKVIHGHNKVVANYVGAEGLKTGFTCPAGFNLITTASRGNKALIGVVTGSSSGGHRDQKMVQLLDKHFGVAEVIKVKKKPKAIKVANVKQKKRVMARS